MGTDETELARAHAIEDSNLAAWGGKELLRLEVLMDYSKAFSADSPDVHPVAAVRWAVLSDEFQNETSVREFKIILTAFLYAKALAVDHLTAELFQHVGNALRECQASADLSATKPFAASELILAPLFVKAGPFTNIVWPWEMSSWSNDYHETPDRITVSKVFAMNAAMEVLASGGRRKVAEFRGLDWRRREADKRHKQQIRDAEQEAFPVVDWTPFEKRLADSLGSVFNWFRRK